MLKHVGGDNGPRDMRQGGKHTRTCGCTCPLTGIQRGSGHGSIQDTADEVMGVAEG